MAISMTRDEYQAKYGTPPPVVNAPQTLTRAQYQVRYGEAPPINPSQEKSLNRPPVAPIGTNSSSLNLFQPNLANNPIISGLQQFGTGVAKGVGSTVRGLGELGTKIGEGVGLPALKGTEIYKPATPQGAQVSQALTPEGIGQNIGFGTEKFAEFFAPMAQQAKAEQSINLLSQGIKSPLLAATTRIVGKGVAQGVATGGVTAIQSGGNLGETIKSALTAGIFRSGLATIGEGARAIKLPERLYSTIFKNSYNDMKNELTTEVIANLEKTNPEKYKSLVDAGIIKTSEGAPIVDDTIAKQALDKGLRGSIRGMARTVIEGTLDSEAAAQNVARTHTGTISLAEPQFGKVLKEIAQEYDNVGFGEIAQEASRLADDIAVNRGNVSLDTALGVRRLLDRARIARSFDVPVNKLSLSQANLKTLADAARSRVNAVPEMGAVMKNYSFYIDAVDALAKEAARRGNNQALSLIDSLFLSGAFGANSPIPGATAGMFRKFIMSGPGTTGLAQTINNSVATGASGVIGAASNLGTKLLSPQ